MTMGGAGCGKQPFEFHGSDHVGIVGVLVIVESAGIKRLEPGGEDNGTCIQGDGLFRLGIVNGVCRTDIRAGTALVLLQFQADVRVDDVFQGHCLGIFDVDSGPLLEISVVTVIMFSGAFLSTGTAADTEVFTDVPGFF
tara:strand:- start:1074 stop:1490 length:417 start_codon:yes stop_codon:yes gene_type:complete